MYNAYTELLVRNGLGDSQLLRDLKVEVVDSDNKAVISFMINDYIKYIVSGRKPGSKFPPPTVIAQWCKRKGLPSDNSTVFLICRHIAVHGIPARPEVDPNAFAIAWFRRERTRFVTEFVNQFRPKFYAEIEHMFKH